MAGRQIGSTWNVYFLINSFCEICSLKTSSSLALFQDKSWMNQMFCFFGICLLLAPIFKDLSYLLQVSCCPCFLHFVQVDHCPEFAFVHHSPHFLHFLPLLPHPLLLLPEHLKLKLQRQGLCGFSRQLPGCVGVGEERLPWEETTEMQLKITVHAMALNHVPENCWEVLSSGQCVCLYFANKNLGIFFIFQTYM